MDLDLKGFYDSDSDSLLMDFYIPVLTESIKYRRIAGYFSSNSLAIAAKGLSEFVNNGGTIQLIANVVLSEDDQDTIKKVIHQKEQEILSEMEFMDDALKKGHLRFLAWLLKNDKLEIKIAKVNNGLEHKKKGILEDSEGNIVSFSGSDNETVSGWLHNHEDFHVFCSWIEGDRERHLDHDIMSFQKLWNNETNKVSVYHVSDAFKEGLIKNAPSDSEEFSTLSNEITQKLLEELSRDSSSNSPKEKISRKNLSRYLRDYQEEAIEKWEQNGHQGILKMATGTGKTFTAINAIERHLSRQNKGFVVIVAPKQLLVSQWSDELKKLGYSNVVEVMKDSSKWENELKASLLKMDLGRENEIFAVATYASFSSDKFKSVINSTNSDILLVCDEMHNSWAPKYKTGFLDKYHKKLGLSATPERYMDDEGTQDMLEYFGGVVFEFGLGDAIPTFLAEYEYHAELVHLTVGEKYEYDTLTSEIGKMIAANDGHVDDRILLKILRRARIVTNSESKWEAFEKILNSIYDVKKTLVYCSDKQIGRVMELLRSRKIPTHKITYKEPLSFRKEIIEQFTDEKYKVIVAIKVLDEGIDVPGIERAIILANSGNPIEYVQRRGRILRKSPGKEYAIIHDILIFPWEDIPILVSNSDISMIKKEIIRIEEFSKASMNPLEVLNQISPYYRLIEEW
jgi:superfamily II DNA or RNA helicase